MAVTYSAGLKTTRMQAVRDAIDADAGAGSLEIGTSGFSTTLVAITLADPASSVATDTLTFLGLPKTAVATGAGTAAEARVKDNSGDIVISGLTVGTSGTNIIIDNTNVAIGQTISFNATSTITHG